MRTQTACGCFLCIREWMKKAVGSGAPLPSRTLPVSSSKSRLEAVTSTTLIRAMHKNLSGCVPGTMTVRWLSMPSFKFILSQNSIARRQIYS